MKQKRRTVTAITVGLLSILLFLVFSANLIVLNGYLTIESEETRNELEKISASFENELDFLSVSVADNAADDEAYRFVLDRNERFIRQNLTDKSFAKLRVNIALFVQPNGEIIHSYCERRETLNPELLPQLFAPLLNPASPLMQCKIVDSSVKGIVVLAGTPVLIAARPVLTSISEGPVHGLLIMGRILDKSELARLKALTRQQDLGVTVCAGKAGSVVPYPGGKPLTLASSYGLQRLDNNTLNGFVLLGDLFKRPALLVKVPMSRNFYHIGVKTVRYFIAWAIVISLLAIYTINKALGRFYSTKRRADIERLYTAAVEGCDQGVAIIALDSGRIVQANVAVTTMLGYTPGQLDGTLFREILAEGVDLFAHCREEVIAGGKAVTQQFTLNRDDVTTVAVTVRFSLTGHDDERYICLLISTAS